MCTPKRYVPFSVFSTHTASSKSFASSPSIVNISLFLKSSLFFISVSSINGFIFFASSITGSGNSYGRRYSFTKDNISTPASSMPPSTSITFPSAFLPFKGNLVILTTTLSFSFAFPKFFLEIYIYLFQNFYRLEQQLQNFYFY